LCTIAGVGLCVPAHVSLGIQKIGFDIGIDHHQHMEQCLQLRWVGCACGVGQRQMVADIHRDVAGKFLRDFFVVQLASVSRDEIQRTAEY